MRTAAKLGAVSALVVGICGFAPELISAQAAPAAPVVVVSHLNNPRQISLVGDDELLIAEAGNGGTIKTTGPDGEPTYIGNSGAVVAVLLPQFAHLARPVTLVRHLMSGAAKDGSFAVGSDGVDARGPHGRIFVQETLAPPNVLPIGLKIQNGRTLSAYPYGAKHAEAYISGFEKAHDPDHKGFDSDPYAVIARRTDLLVADAAANDVLRIDANGGIHLWHVFGNVKTGACKTQNDPSPKFPGCNFVPTSMTIDSRGHVYVGGLSSLTPGEAQVVELSSDGTTVIKKWGGFTAVTGVAINRHGDLYVSELFAPEAHPANPQIQGVVTKVSPSGQRTSRDVPFPAGLAINSKGTLFVAAWSGSPAGGLAGPGTSGQVWRLTW
jgi:hypothetical protein